MADEPTFIKPDALNLILGASQKLYPREFSCQLRGKGNTITEAIVLPQTQYGHGFSRTMLNRKPIDSTIIGSAHSHPSRSFSPSKQDLVFFSRLGHTHLIIRYPFEDIKDVACYNRYGQRKPIDVAP